MKTKEFSAIVKGAKVELNGTFKNPFVVVNLLNKAAKGDFTKVSNCSGLTRENLAKVAKACKGMHDNRYAFDVCLFTKDYKGRFCTIGKVSKNDTISYDYIDVIVGGEEMTTKVGINAKGNEVIGENVLSPIPCTINGFFNAFAKVAKVEIRANEIAANNAAKEAEKANKMYNNMVRDINKAYTKGVLSEVEYNDKLQALKALYNK